jgi:ABC-type branched-subunit amino acid transport system substrate-binding protein
LADFDRRRARAQAAQRQSGAPVPRRTDALEGLEDLPYQALIVPEFGERLKSLAPLLPFYGVDQAKVKLIGTSQWDDPQLTNEPSLFGAWFAAPTASDRDAFVQRYERAFGRRPHRLASLAYDATALTAVLARQAGGKADFADALRQPSGFHGVDGLFRFGPDGAIERGLAMFEIVQRGQRVIDPAPESFVEATN